MAALDLDITSRLRDFTVDVGLCAEREVVALVGPSGAGKTTVLRAVAGLHRPDAGRVRCGDAVWFARGERGDGGAVDLPPERRSVGYVPQHHALFPHLTVTRNVAFSGATEDAVTSLLTRFGIAHLSGERPARLSGGERQRVALARALGRQPQVLLLDEPLAALDAHTRRVVRDELAQELRALAIPTLLVTHDFADATALADRVAVIVEGTLRQLATPGELVEHPADRFVVALTGGSVVRAREGASGLVVDGDGPVDVAVYPWEVDVRPGPGPAGALEGTVRSAALEAGRLRVRVGDWTGEAVSLEGLEPGRPAHGVPRRLHRLGAAPGQ
ncbi:sulfate/molybdate ABC transporter ATP-binding protein [Conexibacter woesei]|uniref:sulfate/molybdate ABC transporter ATP-binding protein n=1 Tax=Conexibacter woesei TaxID=191495 RepID=UPI00068838C6|nr:ABC transporter ATP-binding protein [Conexibacter woesei]